MKLSPFFLIVSLTIYLTSSSAQSWVTVNPLPTPTNINGISFVNADTGFLACGESNIFRTRDGGLTWDKYNTNLTNYYVDITFVNENKGFIIGNSSTIGRTLNNGNTWSFQKGPGESTYQKISFLDEQYGWICGYYSTILRTQDGGLNWQLLSQDLYHDNNYFCADFLDKDTGYFAGCFGISGIKGRLSRTVNGGVSVTNIPLPITSQVISDIKAIDYNNIWLCEGRQIGAHPRLYHTIDAGLNWDIIELGSHLGGSAVSIEFLTPLKVRVIGDHMSYSSEDGGVTWVEKPLTSSYQGYSIACSWATDSIGYVCGYNGFLVKTQQSGNSWQSLSQGSHAAFSSIDFANSQVGCAVGSAPSEDFIYHTSDGGQTWVSALNSTKPYGWIYNVLYRTATDVWASGNMNRIYHSTDGGTSWNTINPVNDSLSYYYSLCAVSDGRIYAGGKYLIYSDDNGLNWQWNDFDFPGYKIRKVLFPDPHNGYLVLWETGTSTTFWGKLFRTQNEGLTWQEINYNANGVTSKILAADFITKDKGIISIYGSGLSTTTDGGNTWSPQGYIGNMQVVYLKMFNEKEVVATTISGQVFYSFNGGITWTQAQNDDTPFIPGNNLQAEMNNNILNPTSPEGVDGLWGFCFKTMGSGWLCEDNGLIRKYTDLFVGTDDFDKKAFSTYQLYPNPATNFIQIVGDKEPEFISVYTNQGKCIKQFEGPVSKIDVSLFPSGVYLMQLTCDKKQYSLKFVKY